MSTKLTLFARALLLGLPHIASAAPAATAASSSETGNGKTLLVTTTVSNTPYTITFGPSTVSTPTVVVENGVSTTQTTTVPAGGAVWAILGALPAALVGLPNPVPPPEAPITPDEPTGGEPEDDPNDECKKEEYPQCKLECTIRPEVDDHTITTISECATKAECTSTITTCSGAAKATTATTTVSDYVVDPEPTDVGDSHVDMYEDPASYTDEDGINAQYPMIESEYSKLGIEDKSSTECAKDAGSTFSRDETYKNILTFCKNNAGKKPGTNIGLYQDFLTGISKVSIKIDYDPECTPDKVPDGVSAPDYVLGDLIEDNCVDNLANVLDNCDTADSNKHGGSQTSSCLKYSISSSSGLQCHAAGGTTANIDAVEKVIDQYCSDSSVTPGQGNMFTSPVKPHFGDGAQLYMSYAESRSCPRGKYYSYSKDQCKRNFKSVLDGCKKDGKTFGGNVTEGCGVFDLSPISIPAPGDLSCKDGDGLTSARDDIRANIDDFCNKVIKGKKLDPPARGSTSEYSMIYGKDGGKVATAIKVHWNDNGSTCPRNHESVDLPQESCEVLLGRVMDDCDTKSGDKHGGSITHECAIYSIAPTDAQLTCGNTWGASTTGQGPFAAPFPLDNGEEAVKEFCGLSNFYLDPENSEPDPNEFDQGVNPKGWLNRDYRFPEGNDWKHLVNIKVTYADPQPAGCAPKKKMKIGDVKDDCVKFLRQTLNNCDTSSGTKNGGVNMQVASDYGCINWAVLGASPDKP